VGLLRRNAGVKFTIEKVLAEIDARVAQGLDEFVVLFDERDVGLLNRLDVVSPMVVRAVQDAGYGVVDVSDPHGNYTISLRVRAPSRQPDAPAHPISKDSQAETHKAAPSEVVPGLAGLERWHSASQVGVPFGLGYGLEEAVAITRRDFSDHGELSLECDGLLSIAAMDIRDKTLTFEDWDRVLGYDPRKLKHRVWDGLMERGMVYKMAVAEHARGAGPLYERLVNDRAFEAEVYVFLRVTYSRLYHTGIVEDPLVDTSAPSNAQAAIDAAPASFVAANPSSQSAATRPPSRSSSNEDADPRLEAALKQATAQLQRLPARTRAAAYRFAHGELEVSVVVAGDEELYESLERLGSARPAEAILEQCFAFVAAPVNAMFNNDRTWADWISQGGGWMAIQPDTPPPPGAVRTARPSNPEAYGARTELPSEHHFYVAVQARMYGSTPEEAAEKFRSWMAQESWVTHTYQVVNSAGQAYWWNSGSWSEEWLLVPAGGTGHIVTWDTIVPCVPDAPNETVRAAAEQLQSEAQAGNLEVLIMSADGSRRSLRTSQAL
jgi:hypothetical protein